MHKKDYQHMNRLNISKPTCLQMRKKEIVQAFINSINDIPNVIKEHVDEKPTHITLFCEGDKLKMALEMIYDHKYIPKVNIKKGTIHSLVVKVSNVIVSIQSSSMNPNDTYQPINEEQFKAFINEKQKFESWLMQPKHLSNHNSDV